jgi:hypothetical protein
MSRRICRRGRKQILRSHFFFHLFHDTTNRNTTRQAASDLQLLVTSTISSRIYSLAGGFEFLIDFDTSIHLVLVGCLVLELNSNIFESQPFCIGHPTNGHQQDIPNDGLSIIGSSNRMSPIGILGHRFDATRYYCNPLCFKDLLNDFRDFRLFSWKQPGCNDCHLGTQSAKCLRQFASNLMKKKRAEDDRTTESVIPQQ